MTGATQTTSTKPNLQHNPPNTQKTAWLGLEKAMEVLEISAGVFTPLKSAVGEFKGCLQTVKAAAENRDDYGELESQLKTYADALSEYAQELGSEDPSGSIARITQSIATESERIKEKQGRCKGKRILESIQDKEDVLSCYRRIEASFRQLQSNANIWNLRKLNKQIELSLLQGISPVEEARYNSSYSMTVKRHRCTSETRVKIQADLQGWVQDPNAAKVYWMNGMAGTGKTTIAYSLCEWLEVNKQLGANFFCSRGKASCRDVSRIIPTIACQLARYSPAFRTTLCRILESDPGIIKLNAVQQFEKMIKVPLLEASAAIPTGVVIVIDALDECQDGHGVRLVLATLMRFTAALPVKFFVASRPEPVIRDRMLSSSDYSPFVLRLHDIEESIVKEDIKKYLKEALSCMSPAPTDYQIEQLAERAGKLFIYASTVVQYIFPGDIPVDSNARLQTMLRIGSTLSSNKDCARYDGLDQLYTTILAAAFDKRLERQEVDNRLHVLHTVVCAREPMDIQTLASLLGVVRAQVLLALQPLQSVLHISGGDGLVSTLHASFIDYMLDELRSGNLIWHCNLSKHNEILAQHCFSVMKSQLRFNICNLESSFVYDVDVPNLRERVDSAISPALFYACRYWGEHLQPVTVTQNLITQLSEFIRYRLLFWMEVLNLKQDVWAGVMTLQKTQNWLLLDNTQAINQQYVADSMNFVTRFATSTCTRSTPHIYISALPFCPKSSSVYAHYWVCTQGLLDAKGTAMSQREHSAIAAWMVGSHINAAALSPDGTRIACGTSDNTAQVWNSRTGDLIVGPFLGHTEPVHSIAFSPDGTQIASGSMDNTIRVWDVRTVDLIAGPLEGHTSWVESVAFSPDGTRIASGSLDTTIRLWDLYTGGLVAGPFQGHKDQVHSVQFSPDGAHIASGSNDCTIRVWDAHTGNLAARPFEGHTYAVNSIAFSPDSTRIVSGSLDSTVRVWDARTGDLVSGPFKGHAQAVYSVAFSPDGTRIVSGSRDCTVRVWDAHTGNPTTGPFKEHSALVASASFSPDGTRIFSTSGDCTIRVWDAHTGLVDGRFWGHALSVNTVAFSPGGSRIVSGSWDRTIRVWSARTGDPIAGPFEGHTEQVRSVAFSPDGTLIASGSWDCTVRVWNACSGDLVSGPFKVSTSLVESVTFSPESTCIAFGSNYTIHIRDVYTGDLVARPFSGHTDYVYSVAFSPDGIRIASGSGSRDCTLRVWETRTSDLVAGPFKGHTKSIWSVTFSPDGTRIASGSDDHTVRVWDACTADLVAGPFEGHTEAVLSVMFSPDGARIVSGSMDSTIQVWNAYTGGNITGPFNGHAASVQSVAFSPDGTRIVSGSSDSTIRVWNTHVNATADGSSECHAGPAR